MSPGCLAGTRTNPGNRVSMRGSSQLLIAQITRVQSFAAIAKRDRFKYSKRSLSHHPCYGKWRHMPPGDLESLSPPSRVASRLSLCGTSTFPNTVPRLVDDIAITGG